MTRTGRGADFSDEEIRRTTYDGRTHLYSLIRLGLWDHAVIVASDFVQGFEIIRTEKREILVRWHDRYFENALGERCYYPVEVLWR